ncbi:MAG: PhoH family protein [Deltaproteobacteria bacterium]|nr:PhoH family protein [Deltaproteobacteria bacterium]
MKKTFVLDTSVILYDPQCIYRFDDNIVVVPVTVLEEMDHFKKDLTETGRNARQFSRILDDFRKRGTLTKGVDIGKRGTLVVDLFRDAEKHLPKDMSHEKGDHRILAVALKIRADHPNIPVIFVTKDVNLRVKADALGINSVDFEPSRVSIEDLYSGIVHFDVPSDVIDNFIAQKRFPMKDTSLIPNAYVLLRDQRNPEHMAYGRYSAPEKEIVQLRIPKDGVWGIKSRNMEQTFVLDALLDDSLDLVSLVGKAGTGKTLLALACGLQKTIDEGKYQKLLVSRPIFPLGKDIGYLPGEIEEKLNPWMQPIFDNVDYIVSFSGGDKPTAKRPPRRAWQELINQGMLQIEPLTYIRGRSLAYQFLIVDEAQNLTPHEIKTIITRAGEGTKVVLTGDCYQIDNPYVDSSNNGLSFIVERFKMEHIAAHITLTKGERSRLAELATNLL